MHILKSPAMSVGKRALEWGRRTYIMGILNLTPDSFSGDGLLDPAKYPKGELTKGRDESRDPVLISAIEQAHCFVKAGADILDIGGESTRPGALG